MNYNIPDYNNIPDAVLHEAVEETLSDCDLECNSARTVYTFHCPICGGHKKNKNNKCGYIYTNNWKYICYNGCGSMSFLYFLKIYHKDVYRKVMFYAYKNKKYNDSNSKVKTNDIKYTNEKYNFKDGELLPITANVTIAKIALNYCISRKIPKTIYNQWFVCVKDEKFYDKDNNGNLIYNKYGFPIGNEYGNRLIIPYYHYGGKWIQFDARTLDNSFLRYKNLKNAERELYNIDFLDTSKPFFLLEGAIDSTFIKNSVAFGGIKHLMTFLQQYPDLLKNAQNGTVLWDNDIPGINEIEKTVKLGFNWFDWSTIIPNNKYKYDSDGNLRHIKDINNAVMYSDAFKIDKDGFIVTSDLLKYVKSSKGSIILLRMKYGNRNKIKFEEFKNHLKILEDKKRKVETKPYFE